MTLCNQNSKLINTPDTRDENHKAALGCSAKSYDENQVDDTTLVEFDFLDA